MNFFLIHILFCTSMCAYSIRGLTIPFEELAKGYDSTSRPRDKGPMMINVTLLINSLEVDEARQVLRIGGELQQEWDDYQLRFISSSSHQGSIGLEGRRGDRIKQHLWLPDLTVAEGFQIYHPMPKDYLKIDNEGHMTWNQQIFYEFPCEFDFSEYPLGSQECTFKLQSLGYDVTEVEPRWANDESVFFRTAFVSLRYEIEDVEQAETTAVTIHRAKRQLQATLYLESVTGWPVKHTVLPFVAAVATAYLAFFVNVSGVTARMVLCGTSLIFASIFHESTYDDAPKAPYTMAIEVFTGTCLTFIWIAMAESVAVDVMAQLDHPKAASRNFQGEHSDTLDEHSRGRMAALWLDRCFRVLYPAVFLAFNAVYWILYH